MSNMQMMKMPRAALLEALRNNRADHRNKFLRAQEGYREAAIAELDNMLAEARDGKRIRRFVELPEPEDHSDDYDRAIEMLEMCVDDQIEISATDFRRLVKDDWEWKQAWSTSNAVYGVE